MPDPISKIAPLAARSRWAERLLAAHPELRFELDRRETFSAAEMHNALVDSRADDETAFKRRVRRLRQRVLLRTLARDLASSVESPANLAEVCRAMTELAETSVRAALAWIGEPELIVVAMGKFGGGELNVSSDIDLVFVHPDGRDAERLERTGRRLIALLNDVTEDGFVFRV